jgi:hypothetical protein
MIPFHGLLPALAATTLVRNSAPGCSRAERVAKDNYMQGQPLMGAWQQICGAWQQIVGQSQQGGPGAMQLGHGAYGDPNGALGGHRHHQANGGLAPAAYLRDMGAPTMANRQVLPMNTGTTPVPINATAQITSRPQRVAFRPERVFVSSSDIGGSGTAANWIVNDITIGNKSQFAQSGALPGDMFSSTAIDSFVTFETAQTAMDVVMIVTYQGATVGGTPFYGSIIGTAAL